MDATQGRIDPDIGNAIRGALVDWCEAYQQPKNECRFVSVRVRLNVQGVDPRHAVEVQCEATPGRFDELKLQRAILGFAGELKTRFGVTLDELDVESKVWMTFLGPDGQHIPAVVR